MPEIWISTRRTDSFTLGQSRIGGRPDLPRLAWPRHRVAKSETTSWPEWSLAELRDTLANGQVIEDGDHYALALPFVAQLDLAELAAFDTPLPRTGHLWLFADQQTTLGTIENYPFQACACLYRDRAELVAVEPPPTPETLPALALTFALGDGEQAEPRHAVMPDTFAGVIGDIPPPGYQGVLRVDSDYTLDETLNWGDAAWITFAIPPADLAAGRWDAMRAFRFCG